MRTDLTTKSLDEKFGNYKPDQLRDMENLNTSQGGGFYKGIKLQADNNTEEASTAAQIGSSEREGSFSRNTTQNQTSSGNAFRRFSRMNMKNIRRNSAIAAVIISILGGGGFMATLLGPAAAPLQLKEIFTAFSNDQLKAVDSRSASVMRAKFKSTGGKDTCTAALCKEFNQMSEKEAKNLESRDKRFKVNLTDVENGSGKISDITFTDDGKSAVVVNDANKFTNLIENDQAFRSGWSNVYNTNFESVSDPKARETFMRNKATKNMAIDGENDDERRKRLNEVVISGDDADRKNIIRTTDKDGKTTYTDSDGNTYTQAEYDEMSRKGDRINDIVKAGGQDSILNNSLSRALTADQVGENVCTTYNFMRRTSALAKVVKKTQAIRYALALVLTLSDKIKAGDATEDEVNFAGNTIMATQPDREVIDDSKLTSTKGSIPMAKDREAGSNGLDAPSYKMAAYKDVQPLSSRAAKFSLTGGSTAVIDAVTTTVARVVNGGNPDPKEISRKCGYIQSTFVRVGALGLGIVAGVATFGTWQIVGTVASAAWSIAQPSIEAAAGDMIAGNVFKDISGMDSVDATYIGTTSLMGDIAESRGMLPVTGQEGVDYVNSNQGTLQAYIKDQQYLARATPFDMNNRYSFMGSIVFAMTPTLLQSRSNASLALMNMASMIPTAFSLFSQTAKAESGLPDSYFNSCPDQTYKAAGIKAGPFCEVRHYMPVNSLNLDTMSVVQWMIDSGNVDPETKQVKDNGQEWNYIKYQAECINRTVGWGENESENEGDGTNCFKPEHEPLNQYFRSYTMDSSINDGIREVGS